MWAKNKMYQNQEVQVRVNGKVVRCYHKDGRTFVEGKEDSEYEIVIKNNTWNRMLAIPSVDGINTISGEISTPDSTGYVISGHQSYSVKGFRVSDDKVNAFKFSKKAESYAAKSEETDGDTGCCGVIGVKFFSEKVSELSYYATTVWPVHDSLNCVFRSSSLTKGMSDSLVTCQTASYGAQVGSELKSFDMGTKFSEKELIDKVKTTEFERGYELATIEIFYGSREFLESIGIVFDKTAAISFPSSFKPNGYCKPPKK